MQHTKKFIRENEPYMLISFAVPFMILMLIYFSIDVYPGSTRTVLASDAFSQFSNFHASFHNAMLGKQSFFYTWNASLGLNYIALISYYLGGLFTPLVILFPNHLMPDALYFLTLIKFGCAGLSFWFYAQQTFKINRWSHTVLAICYSLMSFMIAHSELVMWLDAFIYLPLVILGINRLVYKRKPALLFTSYLLLFLTNFYMGFMIAVFSGLYFLVQLGRDWQTNKKTLLPYAVTSALATGASMLMILPAVSDLRTNGEALTTISRFKTLDTGLFDFFIKNMIGVYDTTKYGSIPFIYIGLLPLLLFTFYFVSTKINRKDKMLYGLLFATVFASFYIEPLNLFWQGMHAPNMFLFRYAYLLSFVVIMLAGYGWEKLSKEDFIPLFSCELGLIGAFSLAYSFKQGEKYEFVTITSFLITIIFLVIYMVIIGFYQKNQFTAKRMTLFLLIFVGLEMTINTNHIIHGIKNDWNYPSRSLYTEPYPNIQTLVDKTRQKETGFYRLENLDPVSGNDSMNYNYHGMNMFSSIRNRHSSSYMNQLGFRSRGTNLNIRYNNNTLLMDGFTAMKYNIAKQPLNKFGYKKVSTAGPYNLYLNEYALPLGFLAEPNVHEIQQPENDNLTSQKNLINGLASLDQNYFTFHPIQLIKTKNTKVTKNGHIMNFTEEKNNVSKEIVWRVDIPAHSQAYLSLFPSDYGKLSNSSATITVNGQSRKTQINIHGQYYDLGYYDQPTTVEFTVGFHGTPEVAFQNPQVVALDTKAYTTAMKTLQANGVDFNVGNRSASATVNVAQPKQVVTTIPYDKGWTLKVDGKKQPITAFQEGLISFEVPSGKHDIHLSFFPYGMKLGIFLFFSCTGAFIFLNYRYKRKTAE